MRVVVFVLFLLTVPALAQTPPQPPSGGKPSDTTQGGGVSTDGPTGTSPGGTDSISPVEPLPGNNPLRTVKGKNKDVQVEPPVGFWQTPQVQGAVTGAVIAGIFSVVSILGSLAIQRRQVKAQYDLLNRQLEKQQELTGKQLDTQRELLTTQLKTQGENTERSNRHSEGLKLKKDIYEEIAKVSSLAQKDLQTTGTLALLYANRFKFRTSMTLIAPVHEEYGKWADIHFKAMGERIEVRDTIARWNVIDPRIRVFEYAIASRSYDVEQAYSGFSSVGALCMMIKPGEEGLPANKNRIEELSILMVPLLKAYQRLKLTIEDYQRELQNVTLSELYGNKATQLDATDPSYKSVTLDEEEYWTKYFKEETPWGRTTFGKPEKPNDKS